MMRPTSLTNYFSGIALVIFDKDGTLIDFHAMWGAWLVELAGRLEATAQRPLAGRLYRLMGFDPARGRVDPEGHLALSPASSLRRVILAALQEAGLSRRAAESILAAVWHPPDPVALARPLADLPALFSLLRARGARVAVATSDDRALTEATLAALNVAALVDALVCADDGLPIKPEPDMVLRLCQQLQVSPAQTAVVGDNLVDLQMGRAAGVGLTIGCLSGLATEERLAPLADMVLPSIAHLMENHKD